MAVTVVNNRKEQIEQIAGIMFRERGYAATSMRELAAEVGFEPASLYSHYKSKESILRQICFGIADQFFTEIENAVEASLPADEKLQQAIEIHVTVIKNNADAFAVFLNDWRYLSEPNLSDFRTLRKSYENIFRSIIKEGIESGIFKEMNEKFAVLTLFASLNWIYHWYKPSDKMSPTEIANNLADIVLNGFKK